MGSLTTDFASAYGKAKGEQRKKRDDDARLQQERQARIDQIVKQGEIEDAMLGKKLGAEKDLADLRWKTAVAMNENTVAGRERVADKKISADQQKAEDRKSERVLKMKLDLAYDPDTSPEDAAAIIEEVNVAGGVGGSRINAKKLIDMKSAHAPQFKQYNEVRREISRLEASMGSAMPSSLPAIQQTIATKKQELSEIEKRMKKLGIMEDITGTIQVNPLPGAGDGVDWSGGSGGN